MSLKDAITTFIRGSLIPGEPHYAGVHEQTAEQRLQASQTIHDTYFDSLEPYQPTQPTRVNSVETTNKDYNPTPGVKELLFTVSGGAGITAPLYQPSQATAGIGLAALTVAGRGACTVGSAFNADHYKREERRIPSTTNGRLRDKLIPGSHD
jgi:hypothetical protein